MTISAVKYSASSSARKRQLGLKQSSVLIVGCGGLGCPSALYLAAAGIGQLGLLDYDEVELSNLHRQVLHTEAGSDVRKCDSAADALFRINSHVQCRRHHVALNSFNAMDIVSQYDIVVDASDNVATRYLVNDACVLLNKPLVSGSALRFEGQLTVYHYEDGPCYRCLFPRPPPPETVTNCSDGGVVGMVPGVIGVLQAIEVVKIAAKIPSTLSQKLLLFDALGGFFRTVRLRGRKENCAVCGNSPTITTLIDYEQFCGASPSDKSKSLSLLGDEDRITVQDLQQKLSCSEPSQGKTLCVLDVRPPVQFEICSLPGSHNVPIDDLNKADTVERLQGILAEHEQSCSTNAVSSSAVVVVCRQGNDSQKAVLDLRKRFTDLRFQDVIGGLKRWAASIDTSFPMY
ncbi:adenylyltransferase and sulfurtransferase MOCS3-like isoform X2 [Sycon ciliatum]|uniref:adenylyltransferase and sulfurtransferase MOCS3-like isoform X2 n=1 Tax=Sycon ciliatum TaxID=27933 RepID=UPI0031F61E53